MKDGRLTVKNKIFIEEYLRTKNATQAAIKAGYSEKRASSQGCVLLKEPKVSKEIERRLAELDVSPEEIKANITAIGKKSKSDTTRLKAWELIARLKGMFKEEDQINIGIFQGFKGDDLPQDVVLKSKNNGKFTDIDIDNSSKDNDTKELHNNK